MENKIEKVKIILIKEYYLLVENEKKELGTIHISQISPAYIKELGGVFQKNSYLYAENIGKYKEKNSYSLKNGYTENNYKIENGSGFLGLKLFINKFEEN